MVICSLYGTPGRAARLPTTSPDLAWGASCPSGHAPAFWPCIVSPSARGAHGAAAPAASGGALGALGALLLAMRVYMGFGLPVCALGGSCVGAAVRPCATAVGPSCFALLRLLRTGLSVAVGHFSGGPRRASHPPPTSGATPRGVLKKVPDSRIKDSRIKIFFLTLARSLDTAHRCNSKYLPINSPNKELTKHDRPTHYITPSHGVKTR